MRGCVIVEVRELACDGMMMLGGYVMNDGWGMGWVKQG